MNDSIPKAVRLFFIRDYVKDKKTDLTYAIWKYFKEGFSK